MPYTNIKTRTQNAPKCTIARQKNSGEGAQPPPQTPPLLRRGYPSPDPTPQLLQRLDTRAFGARRSRSFSFTTRTLRTRCTPRPLAKVKSSTTSTRRAPTKTSGSKCTPRPPAKVKSSTTSTRRAPTKTSRSPSTRRPPTKKRNINDYNEDDDAPRRVRSRSSQRKPSSSCSTCTQRAPSKSRPAPKSRRAPSKSHPAPKSRTASASGCKCRCRCPCKKPRKESRELSLSQVLRKLGSPSSNSRKQKSDVRRKVKKKPRK